ncbi:ribosomal RNA large subunit methyltransferase J [Roridomyces roridus]|uniref:rRNA methyltransferase 2, mitochondrial n=1 Tax=Roridomyces roridus TaxID=1738132 RepID=A0AAD7FWI6_9AGAR|nr:ribosomal RNA large subunit methyltransferase J [Roridomyces roridus]
MPFRPSRTLAYAKKTSSTAWLGRQARDPYIRLRASPDASALVAATPYRARSAFKLLEMDAKYKFLGQRDVVLDLGCAPGGWSQVVAEKLGWSARPPAASSPNAGWSEPTPESFDPLNISDLTSSTNGNSSTVGRGVVIGVDLLRMTPIPGVQFLQADFLAPDTEVLIDAIIARTCPRDAETKADVILCDMASNSTGNAFHDIESSLSICNSVFEFSQRHWAQSSKRELGGVLLIKHFVHPLLHIFRKEKLEPSFKDVRFIKPNASRTESKEGYFLCRGWKG